MTGVSTYNLWCTSWYMRSIGEYALREAKHNEVVELFPFVQEEAQWGVSIHNVPNFFPQHQTSWISVSKLGIEP